MKRSAWIIGLTMLSSPAAAIFDDGNGLYDICTNKDGFSRGMCMGLISG